MHSIELLMNFKLLYLGITSFIFLVSSFLPYAEWYIIHPSSTRLLEGKRARRAVPWGTAWCHPFFAFFALYLLPYRFIARRNSTRHSILYGHATDHISFLIFLPPSWVTLCHATFEIPHLMHEDYLHWWMTVDHRVPSDLSWNLTWQSVEAKKTAPAKSKQNVGNGLVHSTRNLTAVNRLFP